MSAANAKKFKARVSAVNSDAADTLTVTYKGAGVLSVSETLTDGTDAWTSTSTIQHNVFGIKNKCTTLVMQKSPSVEVERIQKQFGDRIKNGMLYGLKTFNDNANYMVDVRLNAS